MTWKFCWRCIMRIDDFFESLFLFCFVLMFARKIFCGLKRQRLMLRTNLANYLFKQQKETWKLLALFLKLFSNTRRMIRRWLCHWVQICELTHGPAYLFVFYFLFFFNSTLLMLFYEELFLQTKEYAFKQRAVIEFIFPWDCVRASIRVYLKPRSNKPPAITNMENHANTILMSKSFRVGGIFLLSKQFPLRRKI